MDESDGGLVEQVAEMGLVQRRCRLETEASGRGRVGEDRGAGREVGGRGRVQPDAASFT